MTSTWLWGAALPIGTAAVVLGAATDRPGLHMALTALVALSFAAIAVLQRRRLLSAGASEPALASASASAMALVWAWAALSLALTYLLFHTWGEWWQYVLGAGAVALVCLFFSLTLARDAEARREDATLLNLARYLTLGQLAGMIIAMIGLVLDAKMPRDPSKPDWAASALFFFGAAALAAISADALRRAPAHNA